MAFINGENHLCITSSVDGGDKLKVIFDRVHFIVNNIMKQLQSSSSWKTTFSWIPEYGYIGSDPSNLGTCMKVSCLVYMPYFSKHLEELDELLPKFGLFYELDKTIKGAAELFEP